MKTSQLQPYALSTWFALAISCSATLASAAAPKPTALIFDTTTYIHRWSSNGQHEFTPDSQSDLERYTDMLTLDVHADVRTGEALAQLANEVLGSYQRTGQVVRTQSVPRTVDKEAEHFVAVMFDEKLKARVEVAFARFVLPEHGGLIIVYSKRFVGSAAETAANTWLRDNGARVAHMLMGWVGIPPLSRLDELPRNHSIKR
jgi:hypothetical protein